MNPTPGNNVRNVALALLACGLWSTAFPVIKVGLDYQVQPLTFAGVRFMLAGLLLAPFCGGLGRAHTHLRGSWRLVMLVSLLQTVVLYSLFFLGMSMVEGAQGSIVSGASPLVAAVMAHYLMHNDRMSWSKIATIALGMTGVVTLAIWSKPWSPVHQSQFLGMMLLLIGNASGTLANVVVARRPQALPPILLNSGQMFLGGGVILAIGLAIEEFPSAVPPWQFWAALFWLAGVSAAAFSLWFSLLKHMKVSQLNMWKFIIPVLGAILSWIIRADESPRPDTVLSMLLVASAVFVSQWLDARRPRSGHLNSHE
jgi:drug/metabolite transporter (DMT)-like permease